MINLGLSRISKLLASTPIPWKAVHIAGTNGKGSVASIISSLLHSSGVSVGRFNSPHLIDKWDCISINQQAVSPKIFKQVERFVKDRNEAQKIDASEFEILTATAFEIFTGAKVDIGVVECGLGGRLDATNVLKPDQVLCSIITKVGKDHEALLGNTVLKIAQEKAGILKKDAPFVADQSNLIEVLMLLDAQADEVGALHATASLPVVLQQQITSSPVEMLRRKRLPHAVDTTSWPQHQQQNLETALLAYCAIQAHISCKSGKFDEMFLQDGSMGPEQISAIAQHQTSWLGRLQLVDTSQITGNSRRMLLDGAHNKQAAMALGQHVEQVYRAHGPVIWVIAMSKGKGIKDFVTTLCKPGDRIVVTEFGPVDGMPWVQSEDLGDLSSFTRDSLGVQLDVEPESWNALRRASEIGGGQSPVVICGSLYLVGDILRMLRDDPPSELKGSGWENWMQGQRRKLKLRKQGLFE